MARPTLHTWVFLPVWRLILEVCFIFTSDDASPGMAPHRFGLSLNLRHSGNILGNLEELLKNPEAHVVSFLLRHVLESEASYVSALKVTTIPLICGDLEVSRGKDAWRIYSGLPVNHSSRKATSSSRGAKPARGQ